MHSRIGYIGPTRTGGVAQGVIVILLGGAAVAVAHVVDGHGCIRLAGGTVGSVQAQSTCARAMLAESCRC